MKKLLSLLSVILLLSAGAYSQAPGIFNYQGVARNSVGNVLINKTITLRLTIHDLTAGGTAVYQESRNVVTNPFGLFNVQVGSPGTISNSGTIAGVNWSVGNKYIQVEIDPNGGSSFINIGTAQIASVPYALFSTSSGDLILPFIKTQADNGVLFKITNSGATANSSAIEGVTNSAVANAYAIKGTVSSTTPGSFSSGLVGQNNGTAGLGIGVTGTQAGSGWGVYGTTPSGIGVYGLSTSGFGVVGQSTSGVAVYGTSSASNSGKFENTNNANTADALQALTNGTASSWAFRATSTGAQGAGIFTYNNSSGTANALRVTTNGLGRTGFFDNTNPSNLASTVFASNNGTNGGISTIQGQMITTTGAANSTALRGDNLSTNDFGIGVWGGHNGSGWGVYGFASNNGPSNWGAGGYFDMLSGSTPGGAAVRGNNFNTGGFAGWFINNSASATSRALRTQGNVQMTGINEGLNKILVSDAVGNATWQTAAFAGVVTGSGTLNFVPKWTPTGTNLGNSQIFDDGTNVGINMAAPLGRLHVVSSANSFGTSDFYMDNNSNAGFSWSQLALRSTGTAPRLEGIKFIGTANSNAAIFFNESGAFTNHLVLSTDNGGNIPHLSINKANGNVGVNLVNAQAKLHVGTNSVVGTPQLLLEETSDDDFARLNFKTTHPNNSGNNFWAVAGYNNNTRASERLNFYNNATGNLMSIEGGGHTGIGSTVFSSGKLTVFSASGSGLAGGYPAIRFQNTLTGTGTFNGMYVGYNFDGNVAAPLGLQALVLNNENGDLNLGTNSNLTQMTLKPNGNVGVTTTTPQALFHVAGGSTPFQINPAWINFDVASYGQNVAATANVKSGIMGYSDGGTGLQVGVTGIAGNTGTGNYGIVGLAGTATGPGQSNYGVFGQSLTSLTAPSTTIGVWGLSQSGVTVTAGRYDVANPAGYFVANAGAGQGIFATANGPYTSGGFSSPTAIAVQAVGNASGVTLAQHRTIQSVAGNATEYNFGIRSYIEGNPGSGYNAAINGVDNMLVANSYAAYFDGKMIVNGNSILNGTTTINDGTAQTGYVFTANNAGGLGSWQNLVPNVGIGLQRLSSNVVIAGSFVNITNWLAITHETGGANYNNVTGEYTITQAGVYQINASLAYNPSAADAIDMILLNNGATINEITQYVVPTAFTYGMNLNCLRHLNVGDKLVIQAGHSAGAGSPVTLIATFFSNNFSVQLVRRD